MLQTFFLLEEHSLDIWALKGHLNTRAAVGHSDSTEGKNIRSSHRRYSVKKGVLKSFANFTGKHLYWSLFLIIKIVKESAEAAIQMCSEEKVFWKYAANLQESTHAEVRFQQSCKVTLLNVAYYNLLHTFRTLFPKNTCRRLLLNLLNFLNISPKRISYIFALQKLLLVTVACWVKAPS